MPLLKKVEEFCLEYDMLPCNGMVIAAVSGGADSMCLLDILRQLSGRHGFKLLACHFDHHLRGEESAGDAAFVAEYCRRAGIECLMGSGDVANYAVGNGCGVEEAARHLRYAFFDDCIQRTGGALVATAHNADDNAETFIMNIMRGAGGRGLCAIPPVRGAYIRPLLPATREEIERYLDEYDIPHREDSTNALDDVLRNRIRHHVTPQLRALCPGWSENVLTASALARQDEQCLDSMAREFIEQYCGGGYIPIKPFSALHKAVASRVVRGMVTASISRQHVNAVLTLAASDDPSAAADLPGVRVRREYGRLVFGAAPQAGFEPRELPCGADVVIPELGKRFSLCEQALDGAIYNSFTTYLFKKSEVCGIISIRPRKSGDTLKLRGCGTKSLKKLFIERKIPAVMRDSIPVIADDAGVLAVVGIGVDVRAAAVTGDEAYRLIWEDIEQ